MDEHDVVHKKEQKTYTLNNNNNNNIKNKNKNRFAQTNVQTDEQSSPNYLSDDFKDHQKMADKLNSLKLGWTSGISEDFQDLTLA